MKLLLDECIDRRLAHELPGHFVRTVPQMGWATIKNGRLLRLAVPLLAALPRMKRGKILVIASVEKRHL